MPTADQQPYIFCASVHAQDLQERVSAALRARLEKSTEYTEEEIAKVSGLDSALFPAAFVLDAENTDRLRLLSMLSQSGLPGEEKIKSHRPYLGPYIVLAKRVFWRVLKGHLEGSFDAIQQFNSLLLCGHARQLVRIAEIEQSLAADGITGTRAHK